MDILSTVRAALNERKGSLRQVADESGIAYDTVLRIKNGEGDPGYSKVQRLHSFLTTSSSPSTGASRLQSPGR